MKRTEIETMYINMKRREYLIMDGSVHGVSSDTENGWTRHGFFINL